MIFRDVADGCGYNVVLNKLNSMGYRTRLGNTFSKETLYEMLRNEKYNGVYVFSRAASKDELGRRNNHMDKAATEPYGIYDVGDDFVAKTKLVDGALWDYGKGATLYGWHISNLKIYDMPKPLYRFKPWNRECKYNDLGIAIPKCGTCHDCTVEKPPQSWCYVEELK